MLKKLQIGRKMPKSENPRNHRESCEKHQKSAKSFQNPSNPGQMNISLELIWKGCLPVELLLCFVCSYSLRLRKTFFFTSCLLEAKKSQV